MQDNINMKTEIRVLNSLRNHIRGNSGNEKHQKNGIYSLCNLLMVIDSDFIRIKGYTINEYKDLWSLVEASAERCVLNSPKEFIEDEENVWMNT